MAEFLKNAPVNKSIKGHKRKHENDDTQLIRRVSSRLAERQRVRQNVDENKEIICCVASHLKEHKKIRQSVGTYHKKKPREQKLKEYNSKEKLNRIKPLRNKRIGLCNNETAHLKSPQHKILSNLRKNYKRLILLDCKVMVEKLNLNKLKFVKNKMHYIYDHKSEKFKIPSENRKLCSNKNISKGLSLLNCKVIVKKLDVNNLQSVKNGNYYTNDNAKEVELQSQNGKLPFDRMNSKGMVKRKPNLDMSNFDASNSNSNQEDLPEEMNEHNYCDTDLVPRLLATSTSKARSEHTQAECKSESIINGLKTEIQTGQLVRGTTRVTIENDSRLDATPYLDNNDNNLDQRYTDTNKVKTELRNEIISGSHIVTIENCFSSGLFPDLSIKQSFVLPNPVSKELISKIKVEPVDQLSDPSNIHNTTGCGSPECFVKEKHANIEVKQEVADIEDLIKEFYKPRFIDKPFENNVTTTIMENRLKEIKSEPNDISVGTQKKTFKCSSSSKKNGVVALRERLRQRLFMYTSENQIKQEPFKADESKEIANDLKCNPDQKNKEQQLYTTKIDDAGVKESNNKHREKEPNKVNNVVLSSVSQNGIVVDDNVSLSNSDYNIAKKCDIDLAPQSINKFALKTLYDASKNATGVKEKNTNCRNIQPNKVSRNIISCRIENGIVKDTRDSHSDHFFLKNCFADLIPLPGFPHNGCTLSVFFGYCRIKTLVCLEKYIFVNGNATQCECITFAIRVQFDGIWNKKEGRIIPFVIWNGIKPRNYKDQLFRYPLATTDHFDVEGKCTRFDKILRIRIEKFDFTLECSNIASSFLNINKKSFFIPDDTLVNLYLRRYSLINGKSRWTILWMVLYINRDVIVLPMSGFPPH